MALVKSASLRWGVIFLCMILGTWLGLFLQRFSATSLLFSNIVDFTVDVREIRRQADALSAEIRRTDNTIQELNWTTELG